MELNNNITKDDVLKFLLENKNNPPRKIDRQQLKDSVAFFTNLAQTGLSAELIKKLGVEIIFQDHYEITIRRKLLYALIPVSSDFPYEIIPLAISSATLAGVSYTWQSSILTWLAALLEFHIIDESNKFVHICYSSLFLLLSHLKICEIACKILCRITRREDVTPARVQTLVRLERKLGFKQCIPHLLRVYKLFRPDLVASHLDQLKRFPAIPKGFQQPLLAAKTRLEEEEGTETFQSGQAFWPQLATRKKANPFHEASALPRPEVIVYAENIEEQKKKMISVLQFRSIKDMIKQMSCWRDWRWPNSAPALLWKPAAIALFKPNEVHTLISLTNWLELALRTEVIDQLGNPSKQRRENLLDACIELLKQTETLVPAVYHFLMEFLVKWDKFSHMSKVLELLSYVPFISPTCFFETILEGFSDVMSTASVSLFCAILTAFSNTCMTWLLQVEKDRRVVKATLAWPLVTDQICPLEGIHFLMQRLERIITATILRIGPHPLLLSTVLNCYSKVNMGCEELGIPLILVPPAEFLLVALTSGDVVATHQLGLLLSKMRKRMDDVKRCKATGDEKLMRSVSLMQVNTINFSVTAFLDTLVKEKALNSRVMETLSHFLGKTFQRQLLSVPQIQTYGNVFRALPYLPLNIVFHLESDGGSFTDKTEVVAQVEKIIEELARRKLEGIQTCVEMYIQS